MLSAPLTPDEFAKLDRLLIGLSRHKEITERINELARETGLPLRFLPDFYAALMGNDISQLLFSHKLQVERVQAEAIARMDAVSDRLLAEAIEQMGGVAA